MPVFVDLVLTSITEEERTNPMAIAMPQFKSESAAIAYLERLRGTQGPIHPHRKAEDDALPGESAGEQSSQ